MLEVEIAEYTDQIWRQALRLEVEPIDPSKLDPNQEETKESLIAFIHFTGDEWSGACAIQTDAQFANLFTAQLLDLEESEVDVELRNDAMAELANMLGGNLKPFLPGPPRLSLPSVTAGSNLAMTIPRTQERTRCWFQCQGATFGIALVEKLE
jgi:CheY-specific phosphatase CheX